MEEMCKYCSQWNDEVGRCDAPYWCPDRDRMEAKKDGESTRKNKAH